MGIIKVPCSIGDTIYRVSPAYEIVKNCLLKKKMGCFEITQSTVTEIKETEYGITVKVADSSWNEIEVICGEFLNRNNEAYFISEKDAQLCLNDFMIRDEPIRAFYRNGACEW